ncbi:MAG: hypothetical protein ABFR75_14340 [Acidobacteriota bacterium]
MKKFTVLRIVILVLIIIFGLKFLSEIFFVKGNKNSDGNNSYFFGISSVIFPVSSEAFFRHGHSLLTDFERSKETSLLKNSIRSFKASLSLNPLNYNAHMFMGKALMMNDLANPSDFETAVRSLKKASSIRPGDVSVSSDTIKVLLSLWPFLDKQDRAFCSELMQKLIKKIDRENFLEILETWGLYSKDPQFSNSFFNDKKRFYNDVVKELAKQELDLESRWKFLSEMEKNILDRNKKKHSEIDLFDKEAVKKLKSYCNSMSRNIKGYYKFAKNKSFKESNLKNLKKNIILKIIKELLKKETSERDFKEINNYVNIYIREFDSISEITDITKILNRKKYFNSNDLGVFLLKQKINFMSGDISSLISETENLKDSITYLKKDQSEVYTDILLLLVDANIEARLITRAMNVLRDIEKIIPGMISTHWRLYRIEKIIGEDDGFKVNKEENYKTIEGSDKITLTSPITKRDVYLFEDTKISIDINEMQENKPDDYFVLKVFLNDKIFYEEYRENIKFPLELTLPADLDNMKARVEIKLAKY